MLRDNYEQNLALANAAAHAPSLLHVHEDWMDGWSAQGCSTGSSRSCRPRRAGTPAAGRGEGLTSPELSVLMAYTKIVLAEELLDSDLPDDPYLRHRPARLLPDADAGAVRRRRSPSHPLRREIIATQVVNDLVNGAGMTLLPRLAGETGPTPAELTRAQLRGARDLRVAAAARRAR